MHIAGVGDYPIKELQLLPDPCPKPETGTTKHTLSDKQKLIYAPLSDLGDMLYDKDAVYVNLPSSVIQKGFLIL